MSKVVPFKLRPLQAADQHTRFCLARRDMNLAFNDWLNTRPNPADVQSEIDDTLSVLRQLRDLRKGE